MDMTIGERIAAGALARLGVPFRLHGRHAETGLDCVGLVLIALREAGMRVSEPPAYAVRGEQDALAVRLIHAAGLQRSADEAPGDIVLTRSGPLQLHLMVQAADGLVHAHAGLGRVVLMPGPSPWPLLGRWRVPVAGWQEG